MFNALAPDPKIYLPALDSINVFPWDAAFVGHAKTEIEGGEALGMTTIRTPSMLSNDQTALAPIRLCL